MKLLTLRETQDQTWFLVCNDGAPVVRIDPGLCIGLDADGELCFDKSLASLQCDFIEGDITVSMLGDSEELEEVGVGRSLCVTVLSGTKARVELHSKSLEMYSVDGSLAEGGAVNSTPSVPIAVSQIIRVVGRSEASDVVKRDVSIASLLRPVRSLNRTASAEKVLPQEQKNGVQKSIFSRRPEGAASVSFLEMPVRQVLPYGLLAIAFLLVTIIVLIVVMVVVGSVDTKTEEVPSSQQVSAILMVEISSILEANELYDGLNIEPAMRELIALQQINPSNRKANQLLDSLVERLILEAQVRHDRGDVFAAGRFIEMAATMGGHPNEVQSAIDDFSKPADILLPISSSLELANDDAVDDELSESVLPREETLALVVGDESEGFVDSPAIEREVPQDKQELVVDDVVETMKILTIDTMAVEKKAVETKQEVASLGQTDRVNAEPDRTASVKLQERGANPDKIEAVGGIFIPVEDLSVTQTLVEVASDEVSETTSVPQPVAIVNKEAELNVQLSNLELPGTDQPSDDAPLQQERADAGPISESSSLPFFQLSQLGVFERPTPRYPSSTVDGFKVSFVVNFTVTEAGKVGDISIDESTPSSYRRAATRALRKWKFSPVLQDNRAISVRTGVKFTFES